MPHPDQDGGTSRSGSDEVRLAALEAEVTALRRELTELHGRVMRTTPAVRAAAPAQTSGAAVQFAPADRLRVSSTTPRPSLGGDALELWVGRYGTLMVGAIVILLGVGTLVVWAVQRGLLSPELRI